MKCFGRLLAASTISVAISGNSISPADILRLWVHWSADCLETLERGGYGILSFRLLENERGFSTGCWRADMVSDKTLSDVGLCQ